MPTLRELRPAKRRSAVSRTIACRSARLRRTGAPAPAAARASSAAREGAAVTQRWCTTYVTDQFAARRRMVALGDERRPCYGGRRGVMVPLWLPTVTVTGVRRLCRDPRRACEAWGAE